MYKYHKIASQSSIRIAGPYFNRTFELLVREVQCKNNYKQVHPRTDRLWTTCLKCMVLRSNVTKATFDNITSYVTVYTFAPPLRFWDQHSTVPVLLWSTVTALLYCTALIHPFLANVAHCRGLTPLQQQKNIFDNIFFFLYFLMNFFFCNIFLVIPGFWKLLKRPTIPKCHQTDDCQTTSQPYNLLPLHLIICYPSIW